MGMGSLREVDGVESGRQMCVVTIAHTTKAARRG